QHGGKQQQKLPVDTGQRPQGAGVPEEARHREHGAHQGEAGHKVDECSLVAGGVAGLGRVHGPGLMEVAGRIAFMAAQSIPSFLSLYRNALKVIPSAAAALVLLYLFSCSACWIAARSISSMYEGRALEEVSRGLRVPGAGRVAAPGAAAAGRGLLMLAPLGRRDRKSAV